MEGLAEVLGEVRELALLRSSRHASLLSALCWREIGAGSLRQWSGGALVDAGVSADLPAAGDARTVFPRDMGEVSGRVRLFVERIEMLVPDRKAVLSLLGGIDLVVPVDPPAMRLPFGADAAEIGAAAIAARAMFLCGPWLVGGEDGRRRLGACLFIAGVVAEVGEVDADAIDAAEHVAAEVLQGGTTRRGRIRPVEFAGC